jgi:hypothetical protein
VAAFLVAAAIQRKQDLGAELAAFLQHLVDQLAVDFGMPGQLRQSALRIQNLMEHELEVTQGRGVLRHVLVLGQATWGWKSVRMFCAAAVCGFAGAASESSWLMARRARGNAPGLRIRRESWCSTRMTP